MSLQAQLSEMETVEDLFSILGVTFDPRVVGVHRMRILKRFGNEKKRIDAEVSADDATRRNHYVSALALIHEQCSRGMREPEPVFRGLASQLVQLRRGPQREDGA
ncbi:MAG: nitrogenase-stabilizing/protective protein NifW [Polyangiaceae bacterium]